MLAESPVEETEPVGPVPQGPFLNQMLLVETLLTPRAFLEALLGIEELEGRVRGERWGPRTLDCDIVLIAGMRVDEPGLKVPHPELANREFWRRGLEAVGVTPGEGGW